MFIAWVVGWRVSHRIWIDRLLGCRLFLRVWLYYWSKPIYLKMEYSINTLTIAHVFVNLLIVGDRLIVVESKYVWVSLYELLKLFSIWELIYWFGFVEGDKLLFAIYYFSAHLYIIFKYEFLFLTHFNLRKKSSLFGSENSRRTSKRFIKISKKVKCKLSFQLISAN